MNFRRTFHLISYLQYPLALMGLYFAFTPYLEGLENIKGNPEMVFEKLNSVLIFIGLATSFSSLQDTTKTQNKLSKKIWEHPMKGKIAIILMGTMILFLLITGLNGYFSADTGVIKELSVGIIVLSLGMFGFLKAAIEMFENHRIDKKD